MSKWQMFKDWLKSVRRHKYLYTLLAVMGFIIYKLVVINYTFQMPVIAKQGGESYQEVWNDRARVLQELTSLQQEAHASNEQALKDLYGN